MTRNSASYTHTSKWGDLMRTFVITAAVALALTGCRTADNSDPNIANPPSAGEASSAAAKPKPKKATTTRTITYRIGGSATRALISYMTPSGQEQQNGAHVPWRKTFKVEKNAFDVLVLTAQQQGNGTITCEIDVDGKKVKAAKSSGPYTIATCDHPLGF